MKDIQAHYDVPGLMSHIRDALLAAGKRLDALTVDDLAPIDELHLRGRVATSELAALAGLPPGTRVLDLGAGLGGSARYLASTFGCDVTGVDLTVSFCQAASELSAMVGLSESTRFGQGNALELPFHDESFDAVWTEHVQMNVADKRRFFGEAARVLRPGGRFIFADMFLGPTAEPYYPVPWADEAAQSWLITPDELRSLLRSLGLVPVHEVDQTERALAQFTAGRADRSAKRSPLGPHVVLRRAVPDKIRNGMRNLEEGRLVALHAVWQRPDGQANVGIAGQMTSARVERMGGRFEFKYDDQRQILVIRPRDFHIKKKEDVEHWYKQLVDYFGNVFPNKKVDVIIINSEMDVDPGIASVWGEYRAKFSKEFTRYSCRVNPPRFLHTISLTSSARFSAPMPTEATSVDEAIAVIEAKRKRGS